MFIGDVVLVGKVQDTDGVAVWVIPRPNQTRTLGPTGDHGQRKRSVEPEKNRYLYMYIYINIYSAYV